jgi:hypothetical protein
MSFISEVSAYSVRDIFISLASLEATEVKEKEPFLSLANFAGSARDKFLSERHRAVCRAWKID